jgi:hypothetical protein
VAAGGGVVFEDEARVDVDGQRIANSERQQSEEDKIPSKAAAASSPEVH